MNFKKLSISLSQDLYEFIEQYKTLHGKTCSEVIKEALYLLQQKQLEGYYHEASQEIDNKNEKW